MWMFYSVNNDLRIINGLNSSGFSHIDSFLVQCQWSNFSFKLFRTSFNVYNSLKLVLNYWISQQDIYKQIPINLRLTNANFFMMYEAIDLDWQPFRHKNTSAMPFFILYRALILYQALHSIHRHIDFVYLHRIELI